MSKLDRLRPYDPFAGEQTWPTKAEPGELKCAQVDPHNFSKTLAGNRH